MADKTDPQKPEVTEPDVKETDSVNEDTSDSAPSDDTLTASDAASDTVSETTDSIDLPEPDRDADGVEEEDAAVELEDQPEDTPAADDTPEAVDETPTDPGTAVLAPTELVVEKRGGFVPMVLGGVVAAAIGFGAAIALDGQIPGMGGNAGLGDRVDAQDQAIADLKAAIPAPTDLTPVTDATAANAAALADLTAKLDTVSAELADLTTRMTEVEKAPLDQGVSQNAIDAYEAELTRLQDTMRQQREEVEAMISQAETIKADAAAQSSETQARAAITRILSALDAGEGYAEPLEDLTATGVQIPDALAANVDGVAALSQLRSDFPVAARNALAATRGAGNSSVGDFFRTQLGVRSLNPRDGTDPDAVLSRAEAAVASGDLSTALSEIETLPPAAKAELETWTADAQTRLVTVEAANGLLTDLNSN